MCYQQLTYRPKKATPAEKVEADARRISLYENSHITPSVEALIRIAQAFDVSIDYLLLDEIPRRPLKIEDQVLLERLQDIQLLSKQDKASLIHILDALIARSKLKTLAREL